MDGDLSWQAPALLLQSKNDKSPVSFKTIYNWHCMDNTELIYKNYLILAGTGHLYALCCLISFNKMSKCLCSLTSSKIFCLDCCQVSFWCYSLWADFTACFFSEINWPHSLVFVYDSVEELAVSPAGGEVITADALVAVRHPLGPEQQLLLGRHVLWQAVDLNIWDLRRHR